MEPTSILKKSYFTLGGLGVTIYGWEIIGGLILMYGLLSVVDTYLGWSMARRNKTSYSRVAGNGIERKATQGVVAMLTIILVGIINNSVNSDLLGAGLTGMSVLPLLGFIMVQLHSIVELWDISSTDAYEKDLLNFFKKILGIGKETIKQKAERYFKIEEESKE